MKFRSLALSLRVFHRRLNNKESNEVGLFDLSFILLSELCLVHEIYIFKLFKLNKVSIFSVFTCSNISHSFNIFLIFFIIRIYYILFAFYFFKYFINFLYFHIFYVFWIFKNHVHFLCSKMFYFYYSSSIFGFSSAPYLFEIISNALFRYFRVSIFFIFLFLGEIWFFYFPNFLYWVLRNFRDFIWRSLMLKNSSIHAWKFNFKEIQFRKSLTF